jgi:alpha-tubulin suppressor-like RCC1 family protein
MGLTNVVEISARGARTYARTMDGTLYAWGSGCEGRLGVMDEQYCGPHAVPLMVTTGVKKVSAGYDMTCLIKQSDSSVWCWGSNYWGQCGDGTYDQHSTPAQVPGLAGVLDIGVGGAHACAVQGDMRVTCWGWDGELELASGEQRTFGPTPARLVCGGD